MAVFRTVWLHGKAVTVCTFCTKNRTAHNVVNVPTGVTDGRSSWRPGIPIHNRRCTGCLAEDGGWIDADLGGGGF